MKASDIKKALLQWCGGNVYDIVLPNFYWGMFEHDVFELKMSGYLNEYEIKVSRSDFKNDFKKYFSTRTDIPFEYENHNKHDIVRNGEAPCNRFFFVVPENLVSISEVPKYAGLIYCSINDGYDKERNPYRLRIVKPAKLLHKNKFTDFEALCRKLAYRESIIRQKYSDSEHEHLRHMIKQVERERDYYRGQQSKLRERLYELADKHGVEVIMGLNV